MESDKVLTKLLQLQENFGFVLPKVYKDFLLLMDGVSIDGGLLIYGSGELQETNEYMQIDNYAKGYVAIGDDGGGLVFLMKQDTDSIEVLIVSDGDLDVDKPYQKINNFTDWEKNRFPVNEDWVQESSHRSGIVDIVLVSIPPDGIKALCRIKSTLGLQITSRELLEKAKSTPCVLLERINYAKADKLIESSGFKEFLKLQD